MKVIGSWMGGALIGLWPFKPLVARSNRVAPTKEVRLAYQQVFFYVMQPRPLLGCSFEFQRIHPIDPCKWIFLMCIEG
jgi:hypothetical protein